MQSSWPWKRPPLSRGRSCSRVRVNSWIGSRDPSTGDVVGAKMVLELPERLALGVLGPDSDERAHSPERYLRSTSYSLSAGSGDPSGAKRPM